MLTSEHYRCLNEKRNFSAEFKRESAQLVLDQNYTVAVVASAMDVGLSTMTRWVKQLRDERQGKIPKASPITPEQSVAGSAFMRGISLPVRVTQKRPDGLSRYCPVQVICLEIQLCFLTGAVSWLITLPKPPLLVASIHIKICTLPLLLIKTIKS